jgi:hypothetical protein
MPTHIQPITPYPGVNAILDELLTSIYGVLGSHMVGMYVEGSLASGDFDAASDIDFLVVPEAEISAEQFRALQAMHDRVATLDSPWAVELEGSYIGRDALRRYDAARASHPNLERGRGERLKWAHHDSAWIIHRHILRERGITLAGPPPRTLIDPVTPRHLRRAMRTLVPRWVKPFLEDPAPLQARGYQSFIVLSLCRVLYTLDTGAVGSKRVAAEWALASLGATWTRLIESALAGRHHPADRASPTDVHGTVEFIYHTLARVQQGEHG